MTELNNISSKNMKVAEFIPFGTKKQFFEIAFLNRRRRNQCFFTISSIPLILQVLKLQETFLLKCRQGLRKCFSKF